MASDTRDGPPGGRGEARLVSQGSWRVSAERSRIGFKVRKMGLYFVKGAFRRVEGHVEFDAAGVPTAARS